MNDNAKHLVLDAAQAALDEEFRLGFITAEVWDDGCEMIAAQRPPLNIPDTVEAFTLACDVADGHARRTQIWP